MKIRLLSDLHCEGFQFNYEHKGEDIVVLAGDIHTRGRHWDVIEPIIANNVHVVMVAGNHEFYHGEVKQVKESLADVQNVTSFFHFLDNSAWYYKDVAFFGGQMCTDFSLYGEAFAVMSKLDAQRFINDFKVSRVWDRDGTGRAWSIEDHIAEHIKFKDYLQLFLKNSEGQKRVVVSHFVPSPQAIHPRWGKDTLNPYFTVDMEQFMGYDGLWLYGHTHDSGDFMVGDTRVVGNPRGYGAENAHGFIPDLILEV